MGKELENIRSKRRSKGYRRKRKKRERNGSGSIYEEVEKKKLEEKKKGLISIFVDLIEMKVKRKL